MSEARTFHAASEFELACEDDFAVLIEAIATTHGLFAAVAFLNGMSAHHCTGLYRVDGDTLTNLRVHDRQTPGLECLPPLPLNQTYCERVVQTKESLVIEDALLDEHLAQHPNRENVRSYAGVPIPGHSGETWGTVCHFDATPNRMRPNDLTRLKFFADMVERTDLVSST
jgi:GAF domain-containing protein